MPAGRWLKLLNLLATNPRMILLFILLFVGQPAWLFIAELTFFNFVLIFLLQREKNACRQILARAESHPRPA